MNERLSTLGLLINGDWVPPKDGGEYDVTNPATEETAGTAPLAGEVDADRAVAAARHAFDEGPWPRMARRERSRRISAFADALEAMTDRLARMSAVEAGIPLGDAAAQVATGLRHVRFAADVAGRDLATPHGFEIGYGAVGAMVTTQEPVGVVTAITPFNSPVLLTIGKLAGALAMGNTVVVKPSPFTPFEVLALGDAVQSADLPAGTVNIITGDASVGEAITSDPRVDMITFTGSDTTGPIILSQAAAGLKRVVLELGGKSPMIVRADADLELAAQLGAGNICRLAGQGCALLTRHLVHRSVREEYLALVVRNSEGVQVGDPLDEGTHMGPLIHGGQRQRVAEIVDGAVAQGASLLTGGAPPPHLDRGYFFAPTILSGVDNRWRVAQDEIFGPVGVVIDFEDDDEAVRLANETRYGLAAAIVSDDVAGAYELAGRVRAGQVAVNGGAPGMNPNVAWGGFKRSSVGREFGLPGILEYSEIKTILVRAR